MKIKTLIEWTNETGGPWMICTEVSPGCAKCYARELILSRLAPLIRKAYKAAGFEDWETRPLWGKTAPRVVTKGFWSDAYAANRKAHREGKRAYWFPSLIDWLDDMPAGIINQDGQWENKDDILVRFIKVISETPWLTWQLLTKRPELFKTRLAAAYDYFQSGDGPVKRTIEAWLQGHPPANVWIGVTTENQKEADERIPEVLKIPALFYFLSVEPMLERIDLKLNAHNAVAMRDGPSAARHIGLAIFGGESGEEPRSSCVEWFHDGIQQCQASGTLAFMKQLGAVPVFEPHAPAEDPRFAGWNPGVYPIPANTATACTTLAIKVKHPKGGDTTEWPESLRVRQLPE